MPFRYAGGTNVNTTFAGDTRTLIVDNLRTHLLTAGWTSISGASGDWILQSALTPTDNLQCRVRLYDPGSGNCARVQFRNVTGSLLGIDLFLLASATYVYRVIANKYQFFVLRAGSIAAREFLCGGVPFLESPPLSGVITEAIWCHGNAANDGDTFTRRSFRTQLNCRSDGSSRWQVVNGNAWQSTAPGGRGDQRLLVYFGTQHVSVSTEAGQLWSSLEAYKVPARIAWGLTGTGDEAKVRGQLWDGAVIMKDYPADTVDAFDAHNWFCITASGVGGQTGASLFIVIP